MKTQTFDLKNYDVNEMTAIETNAISGGGVIKDAYNLIRTVIGIIDSFGRPQM